ncbi:DUF4097 family beta strand repeat-containing protein [Lactobacillus sp. PV034]|uniref:DUF4097 family beta strand repeat-containing protein n=1 Tax=Lactobacillus sp. PV034 TaxID=2594495 RepID=UPI0022402FDD|nr:DUF4097 family beta strand repeat-containing protein [Lactobacillus sp. PV034]QNQ81166.1 DUF4097 domain-containing protein [Lactobacillus sp. PV034]
MFISEKIFLSSIAIVLTLFSGGIAIQNVSAANYQSKNTTITSLPSQVINQVSISSINDNVYVKVGNKLKVNYDGPQKYAPTVQVKNKCLEISSSRHFAFNFFSKKNYNITITLPKDYLQSFSINSSNGNVTVEQINTQKGSISSSNGDVNISNLTSQLGFDLSSSNGDIVVEHLNAKKGSISSSNGDINISNLTSQLGFELSSLNGDIVVKNTNASRYDLSNSKGQNRFKNMDVSESFSKGKSRINSLKVDNSNGDITVD